ncbi:dirigent protein 1-like [Zingiber officinale]|uniref:Dirigent protein n=1 Tax=Zingiber officinale TaxID=94328 RepID=A0A8J5FT04_ZINOF|nr:dirigent protein 1-like [Zingiber officinale]KAG6492390.1 hypothetical protein ZIOFF_047353 [Zingiber officinale]
MASSPLLPLLLPILLLLSGPAPSTASSSHQYPYNEKLTHLHFFFHEIYGGPNATTITVVNPPNSSYTALGSIGVGDNYLREGAEPGSKLLGRAHELAVAASLGTPTAYLSMFNFIFTAGEYNGSSISIFGRAVLTEVMDRAIIGGSGKFRMARGYTISKLVNRKVEGDVIYLVVEYDAYIYHMDD